MASLNTKSEVLSAAKRLDASVEKGKKPTIKEIVFAVRDVR